MSASARAARKANAKLMTDNELREKQTLVGIELEQGKHELNKVAMAIQALIQIPATGDNADLLADLRSYVQDWLFVDSLSEQDTEPLKVHAGDAPFIDSDNSALLKTDV